MFGLPENNDPQWTTTIQQLSDRVFLIRDELAAPELIRFFRSSAVELSLRNG
jgi:hypothetical protein